MSVVAGYFPVVHAGYLEFVAASGATQLYAFDEAIMGRFDWHHKDVRALPPAVAAMALLMSCPNLHYAAPIGMDKLAKLARRTRIIMPDDEVGRAVVDELQIAARVEFRSAWLRYERRTLGAQLPVASATEIAEADLPCVEADVTARDEAGLSSCWWRQVGAAAVRDGKILLAAHNRHVPSEHSPYAFGEPRMFAKRGMALDFTTALHAEAGIVATAAARGVALTGADLYVTTFPCPPCAKLVAAAGFQRVYFRDGYGVLDAETVLRAAGLALFHVT